MSAIVRRAHRRFLRRHPWIVVLSVLGIAMGVAVVLAVDLANSSASRAFGLATEAVAGKATHRVVGGDAGVPEAVFTTLAFELGPHPVAPIVEETVGVVAPRNRSVRLLGVDPFSERPFRPYLGALGRQGDVGRMLTDPDAALMARDLAADLGLQAGDPVVVRVGTARHTLRLLGLLEPQNELSRSALADVVVIDIATAQALLGRVGELTRIDLRLPPELDEAVVERLLPAGVQLEPSGSRRGALEQMIRAFDLNLRALSLLALMVGVFLIYNTMTFLVVQRRPLLGALRAHGATRRALFSAILLEALGFAVIGTLLGAGLGYALAHVLVELVARTINDLYFVVHVQDVHLGPRAIARGVGLGLGATIVAALPPAWEAMNVPPRVAMSQIEIESASRRRRVFVSVGGGVLAVTAALTLAWTRSLLGAYAGMFAALVAYALLVPLATIGLVGVLRPLMGASLGVIGKMAARGVVVALSRTGVAIAALVVAVATSIGVGVMVASFRGNVITWLEGTLRADIYVSLPSEVSARSGAGTIDPALAERLRREPGVQTVTTNRTVEVLSALGSLRLTALGIGAESRRAFTLVAGEPDDAWRRFEAGELLVSEPLAFRHDLAVGQRLALRTPEGLRAYPIAGVFRDYASDRGYAVLHRRAYDAAWRDPGITALGVFVAPDVDVDAAADRIRRLAGDPELVVRSTRTLREQSLAVFDRTFAITGVLQMLTALIAFVGVVTALMAIQLERQREYAIFRAAGGTRRQLTALVCAQTSLMGLVAGLLAVPLGVILAAILTLVINRRSFGWTLELSWPLGDISLGVLWAVVAALLAGLYPAWKLARTDPVEGLRSE